MTEARTAEARLAEVVAVTWPVLLDFDGPVTHLFIDGRSQRVADQLRSVLISTGVMLPPDIATTADPLVLLRWSATCLDAARAQSVEDACVAGEYQCAAESMPTPGVAELLTACRDTGRPALIVSNNAEGPIQAFLAAHQLEPLVQAVIGRVPGHPELMKPHPHSVQRALDLIDWPASECVFIGDSVTDIAVSHTTGVRSIGQAKNQRRGEELAAAGADALVIDLDNLARDHSPRSTSPVALTNTALLDQGSATRCSPGYACPRYAAGRSAGRPTPPLAVRLLDGGPDCRALALEGLNLWLGRQHTVNSHVLEPGRQALVWHPLEVSLSTIEGVLQPLRHIDAHTNPPSRCCAHPDTDLRH